MVSSAQPQKNLSTYATSYTWPKNISPPPTTSRGTLAREGIFAAQIQQKIDPSQIMFNPFLNTREDGWIFECKKNQVKIALADYASLVVKAKIGDQFIDPNLIFLKQPEGNKSVVKLASGALLKHLQSISRGEESLKIEKKGSQQRVIITPTPDSSKKCSLVHFGPNERTKITQQQSKILPISRSLFSKKQIRQPLHPSSEPKNKFRTELHREFYDKEAAFFGQLGCKKTRSADDVPIWMIFCGVGGTNKQYFCHISEDNTTSNIYNSCDPENPNMPVIVSGQPAFISKEKIEAIRADFLATHQNLPIQAAYSVSASDTPVPIRPQGVKSLRFDAKPISYWSHESRSKVIHTAFEEQKKKAESSQTDRERTKLYEETQKRENEIEELRQNQEKYQARLERAKTNGRPNAITQEQTRIENNQKKITDCVLKLQKFKTLNKAKLPHSYTSPTFQFSFGSIEAFYKRLSTGGILVSNQNPLESAIDNRNDVHIPYTLPENSDP